MAYKSIIHKIAEGLMFLGALAILTVPLAGIEAFGFLEPVYPLAQGLFLALDILLLFGFIYAFSKAVKFRPHFDIGRHPVKQLLTLRNAYFKERWSKLLKKYMEAPTPDSVRLAVIEADALTDDLLKDLGFPGEHLADRLSHLNNRDIKSLDGVWDAHRLRNDAVHRAGFHVAIGDAKRAMDKYEAFLKELKIL